MHVLITGASGFIGSHLTRAILDQGHRVTAAVRNPASLAVQEPGLETVAVDFRQAQRPEQWAPHLKGVDVVINAVGIIRESGKQTFRTLHTQAPIALFQACEITGVRQVIQISALGCDDQAASHYHLSKKAADDYLASTSLRWTILRPSIVYGPGARSMALFQALAALPVTPLVNRGEQQIQPIHVADLSRAVLQCLPAAGPSGVCIDLVGPEPINFRDLMQRLRHWLGLGPLRPIPIPYSLSLIIGKLGGFLGDTAVTAETIRMLQRGNTGSVNQMLRYFDFTPRSLEHQLRAKPARQSDRWQAGLFFLRHLLRFAIALVWISAGLLSAFVYPQAESYALLAQVGISGSWAPIALYGASALDLLLGIAILSRPWLRVAAHGQILTLALYTLIISLFLPEYWVHPFGPVVKNLPLLVATFMLLVLERRPAWNT
jgi:uncharacterized protein YbjT (DUF2867 family)/uncharacterized membrane protein YphA (DoxX/SURF4 family)